MIGIFILCYRVGHRIFDVVSQLPADIVDSVDEVVVIDNCSSDDTANWARKAVRQRGGKFSLLENHRNYGYGGSHKVAFDYFTQKGMHYAILFHGDGQGDIDALRALISKSREGQWDFVIGSRFKDRSKLNQSYSWPRRLGNYFFVWLQQLVSGLPLTDPGSGEIAYSLKFLKSIPYRKLTDTFHFTPQLLLYASRFPVQIVEIAICWGEVETSSANIFEHGWNLLKMLARYRFTGLRLPSAESAPYHSNLTEPPSAGKPLTRETPQPCRPHQFPQRTPQRPPH